MTRSELQKEFDVSLEYVHTVIKTNFLPFVARGIRNLVDHGIGHVEEVLSNIDAFAEAAASRGVRLSPSEIYLLRLTAWLHDLGHIIARKDHELISIRLVKSMKLYLALQDEVIRLVNLLILLHRKKAPIAALLTRPPDYLFQREIRLDLLVAPFRLADACDMGSRSTHAMVGERAPLVVYRIIRNRLPRESRKHWRTHMAILGTSVDARSGHIVVHRADRKPISLLAHEIEEEVAKVKPILNKYSLPFTEVDIISQ